MSESAPVLPADPALSPTLSVDDAVRAALLGRASEARSFRNEDDLEGPRGASSDGAWAAPAA